MIGWGRDNIGHGDDIDNWGGVCRGWDVGSGCRDIVVVDDYEARWKCSLWQQTTTKQMGGQFGPAASVDTAGVGNEAIFFQEVRSMEPARQSKEEKKLLLSLSLFGSGAFYACFCK